MKQALSSGYSDTAATDGTPEYTYIHGGYLWQTSTTGVYSVVTSPGILKNLHVKLNSAPGDGKSYDVTVYKNGGDTSLTVNIADSETEGKDDIHTLSISPGDLICYKIVGNNTPTARATRILSLIFEGANKKESMLLSGTTLNNISESATGYNFLMGGTDYWWNDRTIREQIIPTNGILKNLYINVEVAPGDAASGKEADFTLVVNGVATALTVNLFETETTGNDTAHGVRVKPGDLVVLQCTVTNIESDEWNSKSSWGLTFLSDIDGESILMGGNLEDSPSTSNVEYDHLNAWTAWNTANINRIRGIHPCIIKKLYVHLSTAPGAGKSYTFTIQREYTPVDTTLSVQIADTSTEGNDLENYFYISELFQFTQMKCTPSGTPTATKIAHSCVSFIPPTGNLRLTKWLGVDGSHIPKID